MVKYFGETWVGGGCETYRLELPLIFLTDVEGSLNNYRRWRQALTDIDRITGKIFVKKEHLQAIKGLLKIYGDKIEVSLAVADSKESIAVYERSLERYRAVRDSLSEYRIDLTDA